eukprot:jgi/Astpho2/4442/Aster-00054
MPAVSRGPVVVPAEALVSFVSSQLKQWDQAPAAPPAEALGAIDQPRGDTQFTSNTDYQKELQGLIEGRGGLKSLLPGVSPAPSNDKDPNDVPDKTEFKLAGKVRETVQDAPNSLVEKALPEAQKAAQQLPSPPEVPSPAKAVQEAPKAASQAQQAVDAVKSVTQAPKQALNKAPEGTAPKQALDKAPEAPKKAVSAAKEAAPSAPSAVTQAPKEAASRAKVVSDAAPKAPGAEVLVAGAAALALVGGVGLAAAKNDPASSSAPSGGTSSSGKSSGGGKPSGDVMSSKDPTIPSAEAKKRDPFFAGVRARTNK